MRFSTLLLFVTMGKLNLTQFNQTFYVLVSMLGVSFTICNNYDLFIFK